MDKKNIDNDFVFSDVLDKSLRKYFSSHKDGVIPEGLYSRVMNEVDLAIIKITIAHCNGNQLKTSKILGISRNTLKKKLEQFNIETYMKHTNSKVI